jgi:exonuclease SbcD
MKIVHTSDWHIGQTFYEYERRGEHIIFLEWLKGKIMEEEADVLLVAGDVFDSPNPSAESQSIYYNFLRELTANARLQVVIIAGNHDSAARLEAPNPLLREMNVVVRGLVRRRAGGEIDPEWLTVPLLKDGRTEAWCMAVPYLRQGDYPPADTYSEGVGRLYACLLDNIPDKAKPVIAMGHLHVSGAELSENDGSERIIGGLECVLPAYFPQEITYLALGHLHRAQRVSDNVRYSGSPLPMSFSERNNRQGITIVETMGKEANVRRIDFDAPVKLLSIPGGKEAGSLQEAIAEIDLLPNGVPDSLSPFLEVRIGITEPEPSLRFIVEEALRDKAVRLARIVPVMPSRANGSCAITFDELQSINPFSVAMDIFSRKYGGGEMPEDMQRLLRSVIQEIEQ